MAYINKDVSTMAMPSGMNRMGQFPLDMSSVYYDREALEAYATSGAIAYVGQIVSLVDETNGTVTVYSIQNTDGLLKEVGTVPYGAENGAINVTEDGAISIAVDGETIEIVDGKLTAIIPEVSIPTIETSDDEVVLLDNDGYSISAAHAKKGPEGGAEKGATADAKLEEFGKSIEFKVPSVQVDEYGHTTALDEKTISVALPALPTDKNTTYDFAFDKTTQKLTVTPSEGQAIELDLSDFLIASELPEDKNTEYHLEYDSDAKAIKLAPGADSEKMSIDATPFIKDGMLNDVEYDAKTNTLTFIWNTDAGLSADTVVLSDILDPYVAGNKIVIDGTTISHATQDVTAGETGERTYVTNITYDDYGHITGFTTDTETVVDTNDTYSAGDGVVVSDADDNDNHIVSIKLGSNESHLKFDSDKALVFDATGIDTNTTYTISAEDASITLTPSVGEAQKINLNVYTKGQTDQAIADKINEVNGGESAGEVLSNLNAYKKNIDSELWGSDKVSEWTSTDEDGKTIYTPDYTATSRLDELVTELSSLTIDHIANLEEALASKINKTDVNDTQFEWVDNKLNIKAVDSSVISGLDTLLNGKADSATVSELADLVNTKATITSVTDLENALNAYKETTDDRIEALEEIMTWGDMDDVVIE